MALQPGGGFLAGRPGRGEAPLDRRQWLHLALVGVLGIVLGQASAGDPAWPLGLAAAGGLAELPFGALGVVLAALGTLLRGADAAALSALLSCVLLPVAISEGLWPKLRRGIGGPLAAGGLALPLALALPGGLSRILIVPVSVIGGWTIFFAWRALQGERPHQRRLAAGILAIAAVWSLQSSPLPLLDPGLLLAIGFVYLALRCRLQASVLALALGALLTLGGFVTAAAGLWLAVGGAAGTALRRFGPFWSWFGLVAALGFMVPLLPADAGEAVVGFALLLLVLGQAIPESLFTAVKRFFEPPPPPPPAGPEERVRGALDQIDGLIRALAPEAAATEAEEADVARYLGSVREHVCSGCAQERNCWDQGFYRTYTGVRQLMLRQDGNPASGKDLPAELRQRCPRPDQVSTAVSVAGDRLRAEANVRRLLQAERALTHDVLLGVRQMLGWAFAPSGDPVPPRLHYTCGIAQLAKGKSSLSGDSYLVRELDEGRLLIAISDGMGTGYAAAEQSAGALDALEGLVAAGMDPILAVRSTNAVRRAVGGDSYATLDVALVDLGAGELASLKIGAPETYLWRGEDVQVLRGEALPLGVLPEAEATVQHLALHAGDRLVLVSDGVLEKMPGQRGAWLEAVLKALGGRDPQFLAEAILDAALGHRNTPRDDATVLVAGFYPRPGTDVQPWLRRPAMAGIALAAQGKTAGGRRRVPWARRSIDR